MSLRQLADKAGFYVSKLHRMEHGSPSAKDVEAVAAALNLTMVEFYGGEAHAS